MKKKSGYLAVVCIILVFGCSKNPEKKLAGKWQEVGNPKGALEFSKNHKGRAFWPDESGEQKSSDMTWSLEKKENKVTVLTPPGPVVFDFKDDCLVAPNGLRLERVKNQD